jgi:hypothetical protein
MSAFRDTRCNGVDPTSSGGCHVCAALDKHDASELTILVVLFVTPDVIELRDDLAIMYHIQYHGALDSDTRVIREART